ncbi:MAG: hypothetical protein BWY52_01720 [Chloroflexi bacterium ADurb.Bin325]|nr:MAG: hypothetical protein BWY52_01720 [Chloroflexi bacterium ADurb.Bin325]
MRQVSKLVLAYLLWAVTIALGLYVVNVIRQTLVGLLDLSRQGVAAVDEFNRLMQRNAIDRFGVVILGIVLLVLIIIAEELYRTGAARGTLARNFFLITAIELGALFVFETWLYAAMLRAGLLSAAAGWAQLAELALLALVIWLYRREKAKPPFRG